MKVYLQSWWFLQANLSCVIKERSRSNVRRWNKVHWAHVASWVQNQVFLLHLIPKWSGHTCFQSSNLRSRAALEFHSPYHSLVSPSCASSLQLRGEGEEVLYLTGSFSSTPTSCCISCFPSSLTLCAKWVLGWLCNYLMWEMLAGQSGSLHTQQHGRIKGEGRENQDGQRHRHKGPLPLPLTAPALVLLMEPANKVDF